MYQFLNLHPKKKIVDDCVKRALSLLEERAYEEVSLDLNRLKKETGAKTFNENLNWKEYVARHKWRKLSFPAVQGEDRMNGERFCKIYPKGKYLLRMAHHVTAVVDGVIYDTWDCSWKCVYNAWQVK